ncbi:hypothetical protein BJ878DRAFT_468598 [Calycina marina]|uniref:Phytanoyl-CoA dioxygenase n=1 Tax=Calycina marina TaxID=1763456 RepID=A0A9P7YV38_9HELO|nr:hypothetical protein BJ878DRAFT_468598 [Calycina marina]
MLELTTKLEATNAGFHSVVIQPAEKAQILHTDDGLIPPPRPCPLIGVVSAMVALVGFTADNGATVLAPVSHLWDDARKPIREEVIPAVVPARSMIYFLNTIWHGSGANTSRNERKGLIVLYCQPWVRTFRNMTVAVDWENLDAISINMLKLLGFSTHNFMGYVDGRSPRAGVDVRKKRLLEGAKKHNEQTQESYISKL